MMNNPILQLITIGISLIALCISTISLLINYKKYKIDKSKLQAEIIRIVPHHLTSLYPSMENDSSDYNIEIRITNSGYKEELITKIKVFYTNTNGYLEIKKIINPKSQENIILKFKRIEVMSFKKIELIPAEDRIISIARKEINQWQGEINKHILQLSKKWVDGVRIEESDI